MVEITTSGMVVAMATGHAFQYLEQEWVFGNALDWFDEQGRDGGIGAKHILHPLRERERKRKRES